MALALYNMPSHEDICNIWEPNSMFFMSFIKCIHKTTIDQNLYADLALTLNFVLFLCMKI